MVLNLLCFLVVPVHPAQESFVFRLGILCVQDMKDVLGKDVYNCKFNIGNVKAAAGAGRFQVPVQPDLCCSDEPSAASR